MPSTAPIDPAAVEARLTQLGASAVAPIEIGNIRFDYVFRELCRQNSCGFYGKNLMCPPYCGEPDGLIDKIKTYTAGILFQTIYPLEDSFDIDGWREGSKVHDDVTLKIKKYMGENYGPQYGDWVVHSNEDCKICPECMVKSGGPCRFPLLASPSLEACCIDVRALCEKHGLRYINGENTVTYDGVVFYK